MSSITTSRRRLVLGLIVGVVVVVLLGTRVATFATDVAWFDSVGYADVFWTLLSTRLGLGLAAGLGVAALLAVNLLIARRLAPAYRIPTAQEETIERYREGIEPYARPLLLAVAALVGVASALSLSAEWETFLLWANRVPFGIEDPHFGRDLGFFVFELPLLVLLNSWLFTSLVVAIVMTVVAHYLFGGIRPQSPGQRIVPQANVHLSVLLAALVAVRAWGFLLDQYLLSYSQRGVVTGLSYTDVNAQLLAYQLLAVIAAVCVVLFLVNIRFRGWLLPAGGVAILLVFALVLSVVYPAVIQRVQVDPQELAREREFISRNLDMTRYGFGLDDVETSAFPAESELTAAEVTSNTATLSSIRLWDPATLENTYQQLQEFRPYYDFRDVDVDRYTIDGEPEQVMISVREYNELDLPEGSSTWQNERLFYTHGYGVVSSDVSVANDGQPVFLQNDIPQVGAPELAVENPRVYFGENPPLYSIVDTEVSELDYPTESGGQVLYTYTGEAGVGTGSLLGRLAFALRFAEPNFLLSSLINPSSRVLFHRDIVERAEMVAPFLEFDHDPYPVATEGRIKYVLDAYTTSQMLPYSQRVDLGALTQADQLVFTTTQNEQGELVLSEEVRPLAGIEGTANYIRNSVKAVVDAYDGSVELYVADPDDPIIQAWQRIFPSSFHPLSEAGPELGRHFRVPEDMFRVQTALYTRYHIPEADAFYSAEDAWAIPVDAAYEQNLDATTEDQRDRPLRPYYLLMRLPGEEQEEFALIQPFTPAGRQNLIGWLAARSDQPQYGELRNYLMPPNTTVLGPEQVQAVIDQDDAVAEQITLWNSSGSRVIYGNLLVIPVEDSLLYAQPLFLRAQQSEIPELAKAVLVLGNQVVMEDTLAGALAALFGDAAPQVARIPGVEDAEQPDEAVFEDPGEGGEAVDPQVRALITEALEAFAAAELALREGDLGAYAEQTRAAQELLVQAQRLSGAEPPADPEPAPSPTPTPTPVPSPSPTDG